VDFLDHTAHGLPEVIAFALLDFSLEALRTAPFHKQTFDFPSDREHTFKVKEINPNNCFDFDVDFQILLKGRLLEMLSRRIWYECVRISPLAVRTNAALQNLIKLLLSRRLTELRQRIEVSQDLQTIRL